MVLSVGEILVDMIGENTPDGFIYHRKAGGAPFNVACTIAKLKGDVSFVGSVGDDLIGNYLLDVANKQNFKNNLIKVDKTRNTTLAFVELDEHGERNFCFYRHNTADFMLPEISDELLNETKILHIGSLMLSTKEGREYVSNLVDKAHKHNILVSFDVNYREDIFKDKNEARNSFLDLIDKVDILKLTEEEINILTSPRLGKVLKEKLIFITLGKDGSRYVYKNDTGITPSIKVNVVDTTGAGDAYFGGILYSLDKVDIKDWNHDNLMKVIRFANICGALNVQYKGAIDHLPTLEDVLNYI